jgi:hypothetical protein
MNDRNNSPGCERASDLIAFLYNEVDEGEAREFQSHLNQCGICRDEAASFGVVRESIVAWRDEALPHFVPTVAPQVRQKSAMDALRQFFDLSPLWLKGAAGFAVLALCVATGWAVFRDNGDTVTSQPAETYTAQDVDRLVKEALAKQQQQAQQTATNADEKVVAVNVAVKPPKAKKSTSFQSNQSVRSRRPLSRAEREQLAADLRLLADDDDTPLQLLGDRINQ